MVMAKNGTPLLERQDRVLRGQRTFGLSAISPGFPWLKIRRPRDRRSALAGAFRSMTR
jgi:hypothetical protein